MGRMLLLLIALGTSSVWANDLRAVKAGSEFGHFAATYEFSEPIKESDVKVEHFDNGVQLRIAKVKLLTDKNLTRVGENGIKSVLTVKDDGGARSRIFFEKETDVETSKNSLRWKIDGQTLQALVKNPEDEWSMAALGIETVRPNAIDDPAVSVQKAIDEEFAKALVAAKTNEAFVPPAESAPMKAPAVKPTDELEANTPVAKSSLREKDIPVLTNVPKKSQSSSSPLIRVVLSLMLIAGLALGAMAFSRWYSKNYRKESAGEKIRVLTQHHLGPRKSLAIIRVAGETILIGVTDQNISMIKSLALLDDHMPDLTPKDFSATLNEKQAAAGAGTDDEDSLVLGTIKERITSKIKDLRPLG